MKKVLEIGPDIRRGAGGMAEVIRLLTENRVLGKTYGIEAYPSYTEGPVWKRFLFEKASLLRFSLMRREYDIYHIHITYRRSAFRKAAYCRRIRKLHPQAVIVLHMHGGGFMNFYEGLHGKKKELIRQAVEDADCVIAIWEGMKQQLEEQFRMKRCDVIANGIETDVYHEVKSKAADHAGTFLFLGRVEQAKGVFDLIRAAGIACKKNPQIRVLIGGLGAMEEAERCIREAGAEGHVDLLGWLDAEKKKKALEESGTLILPSYYEMMPMVILEAMAAGRAVIATEVGSVPVLVGAENGILTAPGDAEAMAEAMLAFASDRKRMEQTGERNRERAEKLYSTERMGEEIRACYDSLLND
ncbi:MAG: glycosyltransferase family 4 protein [Lachnospiraceae bacterium]|nr:glycosyltransferase family 4 protein [Lachnospiraceae bacterium]